MRWPLIILVALLAALQYPLWMGKGGWLKAWETDRALAGQIERNQRLEQRNAALEAEVRDLKNGFEAIEERARFELGLVKPGEIFVQIPLAQPPAASYTPPPVIPKPADAAKKDGAANRSAKAPAKRP